MSESPTLKKPLSAKLIFVKEVSRVNPIIVFSVTWQIKGLSGNQEYKHASRQWDVLSWEERTPYKELALK